MCAKADDMREAMREGAASDARRVKHHLPVNLTQRGTRCLPPVIKWLIDPMNTQCLHPAQLAMEFTCLFAPT